MAVIDNKRINTKKENKLDFSDSSPRGIADFLMKHYVIKIPLQDAEKIEIIPREESLWKYQPKDVLNEILLHLKMENINISKNDLWSVIISPNYIEPYDPVEDYFNSIRGSFKGESHIDIFCRYLHPRVFGNNTPAFHRQRTDKLIKKWLVACVACWLGAIPNDVALGLISGRGGIGKTRLGEFLCPPSLKEFYTTASKDDRIFDMADAFSRYLFINFEEMEGINKSTIHNFKMLMSEAQVWSKTYHERIASKKKRLSCVIFSSNHNQENGGFILPSFGDTRRFGCIELDDIDWDYENVVDVDQMWSEALNLYEDTDFDYSFNKENDIPDFVKYNERYMYESTAMYYLQTWLEIPANEEEGLKLNASGVYKYLVDNHRIKKEHRGPRITDVNYNSIGRGLAALGYTPVKYRLDGNSVPLSGWHIKFKE